jgi:hypothetical protein
MQRLRWNSRLLASMLAAAVALNSVSCGTLLHPERRGQPAGRLDPAIVLLDAAGLLLFLIPGIIAFAVDFSTGAIYLPPEYNWTSEGSAGNSSEEVRRGNLVKVQLATEELTREEIEEAVRKKTGRIVELEPGRYRASRLSRLDRFHDEAQRLAAPESAGDSNEVVFR